MSGREIVPASQFRKDRKRLVKRGWDISRLQALIDALATGKPLPEASRPHKLAGNYKNAWDVHVAPDWVLIYEIDDETLTLRRTGSHADLF